MLLRATLFFRSTTNYGWSETYYNTSGSYNVAMGQAQTLADYRRDLLGVGVYLTNVRVSDDEVKRDSFMYSVPTADQTTRYPSNGASDIPNTALLCLASSGVSTRRQLYMRGIPDSSVTAAGLFTPTALWISLFGAFRLDLLRGTWGTKKQVLGAAVSIAAVSQNAVNGDLSIVTAAAHGLVAGGQVNILGARNAPGLRGRHVVKTVGSATTFTIGSKLVYKGFDGAPTVQAVTFAIEPFTNFIYERVTHRITGRPFGQPRGRRRAS